MEKYRRIEITAFRHRRVTGMRGEVETDFSGTQPVAVDDGLWLGDADSGETIRVESAEGQIILADALRSLTKLLNPQTRKRLAVQEPSATRWLRSHRLYLKLRLLGHLIRPTFRRLTRKEKQDV